MNVGCGPCTGTYQIFNEIKYIHVELWSYQEVRRGSSYVCIKTISVLVWAYPVGPCDTQGAITQHILSRFAPSVPYTRLGRTNVLNGMWLFWLNFGKICYSWSEPPPSLNWKVLVSISTNGNDKYADYNVWILEIEKCQHFSTPGSAHLPHKTERSMTFPFVPFV